MNPFHSTTSTDELTAENAVRLFSNVFSEFNILLNPGHTFLNGARGSGKTMMLRLMQPDCQEIISKRKISHLKFLGIYIGVKDTHLKKTDLGFLKNRHAETMLNEHLLVSHMATKIFSQFSVAQFEQDAICLPQLKKFFDEYFITHLEDCGWIKPASIQYEFKTLKDGFNLMAQITDKILKSFSVFERGIIDNLEKISYSGAVLSYGNFLFPILKQLKTLSCFPQNVPIYLMIDDADNLNRVQKIVLNTWISMRHIGSICFKISTQLNYNQFRTLHGDRIETPHDYSEINIADRYTTSSKGFYKERVVDVVQKRLEFAGVKTTDPFEFFRPDVKQEERVKELFEKYKSEQIAKGKTEKQAYDYAYRYARPDFIRDELKGNRDKYNYAGFEQLVHISSGNMRQFIEPAKIMFDNMKTKLEEAGESNEVGFISDKIQDEVIKKYSVDEFYGEFEKLLKSNLDSIKDEEMRGDNADVKKVEELKKEKKNIEKLKNLIDVLGNTFKRILLSDVSERRVFSIAIQDEPNEELNEVLSFGIELGYFQKYVIGNKYGTGKAQLLILNRILAPHFGLDPSSFAGYKFVKSGELSSAIDNPQVLISKIRSRGVDAIFDSSQHSLFKQESHEEN